MPRRKQTKPIPLEGFDMDIDKSRILYSYTESEEGDCGPHSGTLVKECSTVDLHKMSSLEFMKKQTPEKRQRDISESDEESVSYKIYQELQDSYGMLKKRLREKDIIIAGKDATIRKLKLKCKRMTLELEKIRKLNICLQEHLLWKETGSFRRQEMHPEDTETSCDLKGNLKISELEAHRQSPMETLEENDCGNVDLGYGVLLDKQRWKTIQRIDSHSKFCKSLAVAIWGIETLKERTVTGSRSNAVRESVAKPPLSPEKVGVIRDCLKERLQQRGYQKEAVDGQLRLVRRFLSEKICDIKRKVSMSSEAREPASTHLAVYNTSDFQP
ncbi:BEN domain-containing protein 5-like [Hoplias malabaricus]|uniref:BEN domain-containing protein 5-like n=1 Tax=Hoplias malabaricus TaxID=27720 RepID=UPI0034617FC4